MGDWMVCVRGVVSHSFICSFPEIAGAVPFSFQGSWCSVVRLTDSAKSGATLSGPLPEFINKVSIGTQPIVRVSSVAAFTRC